ncbi:MAG: cyclic nucleotide-binding domain-containing protein [Bdellovibrio sp.]|nr:cyclic nucleotide-binding domain-containing protein [Bdellovibrio sp.]
MIKNNELPGIYFLDLKLVEDLVKHFPVRTYLAESDIIYKGHIPHAAYVLTEGTVQMAKKKAVVTLLPGVMLGARELFRNNIFRFNAKVASGGKVIILDRSSLTEAMSHKYEIIRNSFLAAVK